MRMALTLLLTLLAAVLHAQNEFANSNFYTAFRKLKTDMSNGFEQAKGEKLRQMGSFFTIHTSKISLPGSDSGRISAPVSVGSPGAMFYFKPQATKEAALKKETDLLTAIRTAWGTSLFEKKLTDTIGKFIFYRTRLYKEAPDSKFVNPAVETYITKDKNKFILGLQLIGVNPPPKASGKSKLPAETDLAGRMLELTASAQKNFADEKVKLINTTQYYTEYETKFRLFGVAGKVRYRTFESSLNWSLNTEYLDSPAEAKQIYEKLKTALTSTGRYTFNPETKEGSRTWLYAQEAGKNSLNSKYSLVLECYEDAYAFSVGLFLKSTK